MGIPNKISPLTGGGDMLPRGYLPAEFLEKTAAHHFNTNILFTDVTVSGRFSGVNGGIFFAIYNADNTSEEYGLGSGIDKTTGVLFNYKGSKYGWALADNTPCDVVISHDEGYISFNGNRVNYTPWTPTFNFPVLFTAGALNNGNYNSGKTGTRIYNAKITRQGVVEGDYVAALAADGTPCLFNFVTKSPIYKTGTGQFIAGMTIPQARNLSKLPVTEDGALTVSLPWEAQWDVGVQNALSIAADKGWTITVQYRDPETIAAYLPINFLEITGYGRTTETPYPYPHFTVPLPAMTATDDWEFSTVHAVNFSTGINQAEGHNGAPASLYYGATTAEKFYSLSIISTYYVDDEPHTFSFQKKNTQLYASFDGQELSLGSAASSAYYSTIGVFVALATTTNYTSYPFNGKKYNWRLSVNGVNVHNLIPALDAAGIPCMLDLVTNQPFRNAGTGSFIAGFSTVEQSRKLATLPNVTAVTDTTKTSLTVSLPWEAQWDEGVKSALSVAADKGWTLTVQYRDPEVATRNIPIGFLESTGTQLINTNVVPDSTIGFDMQIAYPITLAVAKDYSPFFGVIGRDSYGNFRFAHSSYTSVEAFVMETFRWFRYDATNIKLRKIYRLQTALTPSSDTIPEVYMDGAPMTYLSTSGGTYVYTGPITTPIGLFGRIGFGEIESKSTPFIVQSANLKKNGKSAFNAVSVLDPSGVPCMYDKVTKQLVYNIGTGAFIAGFNTPEQSRQLAYLPDVTSETDTTKKSLTVSLPWEAQRDVTTQAALQVAADRGWTITVQYREPEVTTTNIPISFLESTGTQYIYTEQYVTNNTGAEVSWTRTGPFGDDLDVYSRFLLNVRSGQAGSGTDNAWGVPYPLGDAVLRGSFGRNYIFEQSCELYKKYTSSLNFYNNGTISVGEETYTIDKANYTEDKYCKNPLVLGGFVNDQVYPYYNGKWIGYIYYCKITQSDQLVRDYTPVLDPTGIPCMYDKVSETLFYNNGTGSFIAGFDTIEQARSLAYLPDVTAETNAAKKSLTVSLPWEAQLVITYVPAALQVAADRGWTITVQYRDPEADNVYYNKYAACATRADMEAVNPDFANDLTSDGEWVYPLPELRSFSVGYMESVFSQNLTKWRVPLPKLASSIYHMWFNCKKLYHLEIYAPLATSIDNAGRWCPAISYYKLYAPKATYVSAIASYNSVLKEVELDTPNVTNASGYFFYTYALERVNCSADMFHKVTNGNNMYINNSKLLDFPTSYPSLSTADGMFNACEITGQQAIEILTSIPTWTDGKAHLITMGIHIDYQNDTDVLTAITNAETKGWTLTVQWNGTPTTQTVSTFGLRKPSIYAKLGTVERPDGTTENVLDWGHYVTNWEENDYQEFSSIEEAEEHFNIKQTEEV